MDDLDALESASFEIEDSGHSIGSRRTQSSRLEDSVDTVWSPRELNGFRGDFRGTPASNGRIEELKRAQLKLLIAVASGASDDTIKESLEHIRGQMAPEDVNNPK